MNILNRQIKTGHNQDQAMIILVAKKDCAFNGKALKNGDILKCTKSEAKRILSMDKSSFEIKLD